MNTKRTMIILLIALVLLPMSVTTNAQDDPVQLEFWTLLRGGQAEVLEEHIAQFNEMHDDIEVTNVNQGGYSDLQQKLLASISAGNTPPVTMIDYVFVSYYAQNGVLEPLTDYLSEDDLSDLIPGLLGDLTYDGQIYALPYNRSTQGMFYNADLLAEVGIDAPAQSWEEYAEHARILHEANPEYFGGYAFFNRWEFEPFVYQFGGIINDEDCIIKLNEPGVGAIAAAEFFRELYEEDLLLLPTVLQGSIDEANSDFVQGRVGYLTRSTSWLTRMGDAVDFNWGFTMLPAGPNGRAVTNGGANIAISASASDEEKAAAWELIHFLTDTQQTGDFHVGTGYMPGRYSTLDLPEVQALHAEHPMYRLSIDQLEFATATACVARNIPEYHMLFNEAIERTLIIGEDAQTVFDEFTADLQAEIDAMKADGTLVND